MVEYLVETGIMSRAGLNDCLMSALSQGDELIVTKLLQFGADPFFQSKEYNSLTNAVDSPRLLRLIINQLPKDQF